MAYTTATVSRNEPLPDGRARVFVLFTGDAGEPPLERDIYIDGSTSGPAVRQWVLGIATSLNSARDIATAPAFQVGRSLSLTPPAPPVPPVPPAPTPRDLFTQDVIHLKQMSKAIDAGVMSPTDPVFIAQKSLVTQALADNPTWISVFTNI